MGRIGNKLIKRTAKQVFNIYPNKFTKDFEGNKKALFGVADIKSKKLRNTIAGCIVGLVKK
mgnify:CR=1 FL=1